MLLIRNANIIDGTGKPAYKGDIFVAGDKISAIGAFPSKKADVVIDALGLTVTPGFIDVNNDSDHHLALITNPSQENFLLQGVTTIVGGHCGASLAPLLYGSLESIRKWTDPDSVNVNWHWLPELFGTLAKRKIGVNFGTLVGHSTIRRAIIGEDQRDLTDQERRVCASIVERCMKDGALGLSTGLGYAHAHQTPFREISELVHIVARYGGVYSTHLRDETEHVETAVAEAIRMATETKAKTLISHLRPLTGYEPQIERALLLIRKLPDSVDLHFDLYPFDTSYVPIYTLLPAWARRGNLERMLAQLTSSTSRQAIKTALPINGLREIIIAQAPGHSYLVGKRIGEFAKTRDIDAREALLRLMTLTSMRALVLLRNINKEMAERMMFEQRAFVATNSADLHKAEAAVTPERAVKTFPRYLELARARTMLPFEQSIRKITAMPAQTFGLRGRGVLKQGSYADLACIEGASIVHTIVNGVVAVRDGAVVNPVAGQIIRRA